MRRTTTALIAVAALVGGALAFAPATTAAEPVTDHAIVFTEDGTATVQGVAPAGTNLNGGCTADPDATCETIHVTIEQPVEDTTEGIDRGTGELALALSPEFPGADFDFTVFDTDATGEAAGTEVASSGNPPACAETCATLGEVPLLVVADCGGPDECALVDVGTSEFSGTKYYRIEVYYFAAVGTYTLDAAYTRTDGAGGDTTTDGGADSGASDGGTAEVVADGGAAASSVERLDVTGGFEKVGDWNGGQQAEVGDALGQDLEAAYIEYADDTFTFTIDVTSLPAAGGTPEATRYGWSFKYNDLELELDGKFTNYSRGTCDPTAGSCPPPRDPGIGSFLLRGNCAEDDSLPVTLTLCEEFANVAATFDPADGTITIPIPADALAPEGVQPCDTIAGIPSFIGASVWSAPSAFITNTAMPFDDALHFLEFVVPHADADLTC